MSTPTSAAVAEATRMPMRGRRSKSVHVRRIRPTFTAHPRGRPGGGRGALRSAAAAAGRLWRRRRLLHEKVPFLSMARRTSKTLDSGSFMDIESARPMP